MNAKLPIQTVALVTAASMCGIACQGVESPDGSADQVHDSAGVPIVMNARPVDGSRIGWQIGTEPAVSIGEREGEDPYLLFSASDATKLSDERIVLVNAGSRELRVFDGAGVHVATWGGSGEGPSEFPVSISRIDRLPGDSVIVWSPEYPVLTVLDPTGNAVRRIHLKKRQPDLPADRIVPVAVLGNGSILVSTMLGFTTGEAVLVELRDAEGEFMSSLGTHPGMERHYDLDTFTVYEMVFGRSLIRQPWGRGIVITPTNRYEIKVFAQDGSLTRIVRRDHVLRTPTATHVEGYIEARVARFADPEARERERRGFELVPVGEYLPSFASVMADALGYLWVEEFEPPGEELPNVLWTVFDPDGSMLGFVETPEELEVYEIGENYVLGRVTDELGVEFVQAWPLERVEGHRETELPSLQFSL